MKTWMGKLLGWLSLAALFSFGVIAPRTASAAATPDITTQPQSQSLLAGTNSTFSVVATGQGTLSYLPQKHRVHTLYLPGARTAGLGGIPL